MSIRRSLRYCLLGLMALLAFVGFPLPVAPRQAIKPSQEQSQPANKQ